MAADRYPALLIRLESLAYAVVAIAIYVHADFSIVLLLVLFLAPDLSMIGFAFGASAGAVAYNAVHTLAPPLVLAIAGVLSDNDTLSAIGLIWIAHIGLDRALGFGLKYPSGFKDTHIQRL